MSAYAVMCIFKRELVDTGGHHALSLQVASSVEDLNNHCIAFCKEFHVEVLKSSRKVSGRTASCAVL